MSVFVTVTANPSVDRTVEVQALVRGGLHRATAVHLHPGGKGINVARALVRNGLAARAVVPAGGAEGEQLIALLTDYSIEVVRVPVTEAVRSNISVIEPDATVTKLNEAGARLKPDEARALSEAVLDSVRGASWVIAAGSLPPGMDVHFYADLIHLLSQGSAKVAVDTSGAALLAAVKARPALIKPNLDELEEAVDRPLSTIREVVDAAQELRALGAGAVLASLGGHGAVLVEDEGVWHAEGSAVARSPVGAGDALLAGFVAAGGKGEAALRSGVAWATAAVALPGSTMPGEEHVRAQSVLVHESVDWGRELHDE